MPELYIGLMSGTSLDGIDAALVSFDDGQFTLQQHYCHSIPPPLKQELLALCHGTDQEIDRLGRADRQFAFTMADCVAQLCSQAQIKPDQIRAIGSHGQTVRHRPPTSTASPEQAFTLQIGDPNTLAETSGITTVADFRRRDIAAGGQGAPLVPAFHAAMMHKQGIDRVILNVGGMANISVLGRDGQVSGFDTGPGNVLMDSWIQAQRGLPYDSDGAWAASGNRVAELESAFLDKPFFKTSGPKSTGREDFNPAALSAVLQELPQLNAEDVQQSLLQITAKSIALAVTQQAPASSEVYVCGGGAHNRALLAALSQHLPRCQVHTTAKLGIDPDWVEACAFAWLARQTLLGLAGNVPAVTGARGPRILGAVYPA